MKMEDLRLVPLRLKMVHPWAFQPDGCKEATVTAIFWDEKANRICLMLNYQAGHLDFIPLSDLESQYYPIANLYKE